MIGAITLLSCFAFVVCVSGSVSQRLGKLQMGIGLMLDILIELHAVYMSQYM